MSPSEIRNKRILISPLNWGMGHVSRCIGLINQLISQENSIIIACDDDQKEIFVEYFPDLEYVNHEGYPFDFNGRGKFAWDILTRFMPLKKRLKAEKNQTENLVKKHDIDIVISDHRYGFRSRYVHSIFITHQFNLPLKWYEIAVARTHRKMMFNYDEIWIMDYDDYRLAGKLSVSGGESKVSYIGPYSRFSMYDIPENKSIDKVILISGPRVYGQELLDSRLKSLDGESVVVIASRDIKIPNGIRSVSGSWKDKDEAIMSAKHIFSRSGYSTIMDLEILKTPTTLYPTSGQREQEYLASIHT